MLPILLNIVANMMSRSTSMLAAYIAGHRSRGRFFIHSDCTVLRVFSALQNFMLSLQEIIENDIRKGQYYVTGNLTPSIYRDNCKYVSQSCLCPGCSHAIFAFNCNYPLHTTATNYRQNYI